MCPTCDTDWSRSTKTGHVPRNISVMFLRWMTGHRGSGQKEERETICCMSFVTFVIATIQTTQHESLWWVLQLVMLDLRTRCLPCPTQLYMCLDLVFSHSQCACTAKFLNGNSLSEVRALRCVKPGITLVVWLRVEDTSPSCFSIDLQHGDRDKTWGGY